MNTEIAANARTLVAARRWPAAPAIFRSLLSTKTVMLLLAAYWLALFVGTHMPGRYLEHIHIWDKLAHCGSYAGLAFLLALFLGLRHQPVWSLYALVFAVTAFYGVADELGQMFVPERAASVGDWMADLVGAAIGLAVYRGCVRLAGAFCTRPAKA
jgi:VanZ family protein